MKCTEIATGASGAREDVYFCLILRLPPVKGLKRCFFILASELRSPIQTKIALEHEVDKFSHDFARNHYPPLLWGCGYTLSPSPAFFSKMKIL